MNLTNYATNKLADWLLRGQSFTAPATLYFALLTSDGSRANSTVYTVGKTVSLIANDTDRHFYKCTTAGTSASAQGGLYPGVANEVITDGTAVFTEQSATLDAASAFTEVSGGAYARVAVTASLASFSGTQGAGTTAVSAGVTGLISNNNAITWPTPSAAWGTTWAVAVYDSATGGNPLLWAPLAAAQSIGPGDAVTLSAAQFTVAIAGAYANYLRNKVLDYLFRGQSFMPPSSVYISLALDSPSSTLAGSEVAGAGYARVTVAASLAAWSGTQGATTTAVSSGAGGTVSNNAAITFPAPSASWGTVQSVELYDAAAGGNRLFFGPLGSAKTISAGNIVPFQVSGLQIQLDN